MCGITFLRKIIKKNAIYYFNKIQHRGPDNSGYIMYNDMFIGCHRLAITNLNKSGNQPFELNDVILICNGQIYNYLDIGKKYNISRNELRSDVDIILHLYNKNIDIKTICNELDGVFAFVLYDKKTSRLIIARDLIGIRPLFILLNKECNNLENIKDDNILGIASEIKALPSTNNICVFPPNNYFDSNINNIIEYSNILDINIINNDIIDNDIIDNDIINNDIINNDIINNDIINNDKHILTLSYPLESYGTYMSHMSLQGAPTESSENLTLSQISLRIRNDNNIYHHYELGNTLIKDIQNQNNDIKIKNESKNNKVISIKNNEHSNELVQNKPSSNNINKILFQKQNYECIYERLYKAVIKRIDNSERPVAFLCSGGIDSSIIFGIAQKYLEKQNRQIHVFSMEYENDNSYDAFYTKMLMSQYNNKNVKYTSVTFNWNDVERVLNKIPYILETYDPNTIRASIPMYLLANYLKMNTDYTVFLSGEGADELFLGYNYFTQLNKLEYDNKILGGENANIESSRLLKNLHMFDVLRADRTFSAHGLELRVPYLDKDLIDYVLHLDGNLKLPNNRVEKYILREAVKVHIPELENSSILNRQKERFSDGCGFSYVPQLLNYVAKCNNISLHLSKKEKLEKKYYLELFNKYYGKNTNLIIKRELPNWCDTSAKNSNILVH